MKIRKPSVIGALVVVAAAMLPFSAALAQTKSNRLPHRVTVPTPLPSAVFPVVPSVAPGYRAPNAAPASATIVGVTQQPFVGISLDDAIGMALLKNPNLAISSAQTKIAAYQIVEAKGPFDLQFKVEPSSSFSVQPPENAFFAGPGTTTLVPQGGSSTPAPVYNAGNIIQHQSSFSYGIGGETVNGTRYTAGIQQTRTYNNMTFNSYNPYYLASLNLSVTQPLLKNAGMNSAKRQLKLSVINADATVAQALVDTSNTLSQVESAYWSLVAAWRNVAIQEDALKEAIVQQQSNVRLAKRGAAAPIDAVESSTQVSNFQDNVFSALQDVAELQNDLKSLIVADPGDSIWRANLVPTSSAISLPVVPDLDTIVAEALKNRPEVQQAFDKYREADVDRAYARNQALPQADLQVAYMSNGFAGLTTPFPSAFANGVCVFNFSSAAGELVCPQVPGQSRGTMAYAYHNMWAALYPAFNIGLTVSLPLQNDLAKGLKDTANEEQHQAAIAMQEVVEEIGSEARNALQSYQSALSRLYASRSARRAAEEVYASELRRFHNGASTTFLVLQRQVQLNQARGRELLAQTDLNKAVVELQRVEGTILTANNVNLRTIGSQALKR